MSQGGDVQRVLVRVTGEDMSGITAALTGQLADDRVRLIDIEQVVVQGQLILGLLLEFDPSRAPGEPALKDLLFTAKKMGLSLDFTALEGPNQSDEETERYALTAMSNDMSAATVHLVADALARSNANIEYIRRLSEHDLSCFEVLLSVRRGEAAQLRRALLEVIHEKGVDLALQPESLLRRSKRLVVMDMDSTLIQIEVIDELARMAGVVDRVSKITERAMAGELDFEASLKERVALLEGLPEQRVAELASALPLTEGARELVSTLRTLGLKTGVISGGFTIAAEALRDQLNLDYAYANQLEISAGKLTGRVLDPVVTPQRKADLLSTIAQSEGIRMEQTIAIGDGFNDLPMLERAGLGIAFHAKPKLRAAADTTLSSGGLDRILYLLGLHARDVAAVMHSG